MSQNYRTFLGVLLILAGLLLFSQQLGWIGGQWDEAVLVVAFGAGVLFFASQYLADRTRWWAAMVAFIMFASAASQIVEIFFPNVDGTFIGAGFLFLVGVSFFIVYFMNRSMWWAIIPGGVMFSLTAVTLADDLLVSPGFETGGLLFLGLGLTFSALYFLPSNGSRMDWAVYPALSLLVFGIFVSLGESEQWNLVWPAMIIALGAYFIFNSLRK